MRRYEAKPSRGPTRVALRPADPIMEEPVPRKYARCDVIDVAEAPAFSTSKEREEWIARQPALYTGFAPTTVDAMADAQRQALDAGHIVEGAVA